MKPLIFTVVMSALFNTFAFAASREVYRNEVSGGWIVSGTYDNAQPTAQLRVPRCSAQFVSVDKKEAMVVAYDLANNFAFVVLGSETWHSTNLGAPGPFPVQMYFMDSNRNISDRTTAGDYVWGHDPKYYTLQGPQMAVIQYPQIDIIIHAIAANDVVKIVTQDRGMADFELPIARPQGLPAAWAECIRKFPQLMQEDQLKAPH